jgi:hypothetical protein
MPSSETSTFGGSSGSTSMVIRCGLAGNAIGILQTHVQTRSRSSLPISKSNSRGVTRGARVPGAGPCPLWAPVCPQHPNPVCHGTQRDVCPPPAAAPDSTLASAAASPCRPAVGSHRHADDAGAGHDLDAIVAHPVIGPTTSAHIRQQPFERFIGEAVVLVAVRSASDSRHVGAALLAIIRAKVNCAHSGTTSARTARGLGS